MAGKTFLRIFNKQTGTEQRIAKDVFENPENSNAYRHCVLIETKKVSVVEPKKEKASTKKTESDE